MTIYYVQLAQEYGTDLSSRARAGELRTQILEACGDGDAQFEIDFAGVRVLSDSFADELFGILVQWRGEEWFREHVRVSNLHPLIRETILSTVSDRLAMKA